jgi:hypothetical protein
LPYQTTNTWKQATSKNKQKTKQTMKKLILFLLAGFSLLSAQAQTASSLAPASQTARIIINDAIDIKFISNSTTGNDIPFTFSTIQNFIDGVVSAEEPELLIRSNKNFNIAIRTKSATFNGPGGTALGADILKVMTVKQPSGSSIATPFSSAAYSPLSYNAQTVFQGCSKGWSATDQNCKLRFKAEPATQIPAGSYSIDVEYTATQQ